VRSLKSRPIFSELQVPELRDHKCDACNRSGHPAKWQLQFSGKPYHRQSLEDVSDVEDSEDGSEDGQSYDSEGHSVPDEETLYFVGRFCKANAEKAHALMHWRYHLNQWVVDYLGNEGEMSPEKILERANLNARKNREYANTVVDTMEGNGEIKALYRDFKNNLDGARDYDPTRFRAK